MSQYNEEFRLKVVQLHNAGRNVSDLANEFNVKRSTIYAWVKKYNLHDNTKSLTNNPLSQTELELIEANARIKRLEMENDILKQAALIIGRKS